MSVINDFQVSGLFPSVVGGTGTAVKYFPRLLGPSIGVAPSTPSAASSVGQLIVPGVSELNGQLFKVKVVGDILSFTGGGTYNVQLFTNTAAVGAAPTYTAIASTGAITLAATTKTLFMLDVTLFGTTASGQVAGYYDSVTTIANGTGAAKARAAAGLDNIVPAGVNFGGAASPQGNAAPFGLVVGVTFSVSLAQNTASLYQFQIIED